jgi:cytochrome P450
MEHAHPAAPLRLADLPHPRGLPLLGHLLDFDPPRLHRVLERWHDELGTPYSLRLGPRRAFVSADPEQLHKVLRERPDGYRRIRQIETCIDELGANGVFSVEGATWKPQRRLVMEALNATHFRAFFPAMQSITQRLLRRWQLAAARGDTIEMTGDLVRLTVDITTALAFGEDPNTMERDGDLIQDHLALVFPRLMSRINAPLPYWRYLKLPQDRRLDRAVAAIHAHIDGLVIAARRRMHDEPAGVPRNLLEALLLARDRPGSEIADDDVRANVMTLLLAGEDTTAHTLAWTLYFLAQHPTWQERLHAEACTVLGTQQVAGSLEQVRALDPFEAAANEATRLKPIVPLFFMEPLADVVLDGVALPAGTPMMFLLRPAMLDARHFGSPAEYRPDRWTPARPLGAHDTRAFMQFGAGPRVCPGRHLAGVEVRLVLSMLMRSFRVTLAADPASIDEVMAFTMMPSAMPVRLHARA